MLRYVILGLLRAEPRYGYELKAVFEAFLGGTWPLNIGQVYTTLARLEGEGLVEAEVVPQDQAPDRKVYALTSSGQSELARWLDAVETGPVRLRDDFFLRIAVRSLIDPVGAAELIQGQRRAHLATLSDLADTQADPGLHPSTQLLLEGAMLRVEADLRWLELTESRLKLWPVS